jgi:ABC-type Mn2+/Zn2+ transport system permease subunit
MSCTWGATRLSLRESLMGSLEIVETIVREFPYALYGSVLVGVVCAFLGVYIVAKRVVFLGAVLTQVSILGLSITFLPIFAMPHTLGSLLVTLASVVILSRVLTGKKVPSDAVLGFVFASSIAVRILVLQKAPKVEASEVENLLRGDILFVTPEVFYLLLGVAVAAMIVHLLFFKEFSYISFDAETAKTQGFNAGLWEMAFYLTAAVVISVATHTVGDLFVFGYLVIPPVAAMLFVKRVKAIFVLSVVIGGLSPVVGLFLAFKLDFPSSPTMVGVAYLVLVVGWLVSIVRRQHERRSAAPI